MKLNTMSEAVDRAKVGGVVFVVGAIATALGAAPGAALGWGIDYLAGDYTDGWAMWGLGTTGGFAMLIGYLGKMGQEALKH